MKSLLVWGAFLTVILSLSPTAVAQGNRGRGKGFGRGFGGPGNHGHGQDERHDADHDVLQYLLTNHKKITRTVKELPDGVETLTQSDDPEIAAKIKEHVKWMEHRIKERNPIRMRDPLFAEIFKHTEKISMRREEVKNGIRVIETSDDPYVAKLIKEHAKVVSGFVERGFSEAMKNHAVPGKEPAPVIVAHSTKIANDGTVVQLPDARHQPRPGTQICIDVTAGGNRGELNPALKKVVKYVTIYEGAGKNPADVSISVVLHGDATLVALNDDAYAKQFGTTDNPNFDCLHELHEAGVEILVCGQSLIGKGAKPEDVVVFADTAVSALTAIVNLQADGYAYVPIGK